LTQVRLSLALIVVFFWYQGVAPRYPPAKFTPSISPKLKSGIDCSGETGNNSGILIPVAPTEIFPPTPSAIETVWLGPTDNSLSNVGVIVLTRLTDRFHPGCFCVQPPVKFTEDAQAKIPKGPGNGVNGACVLSEL